VTRFCIPSCSACGPLANATAIERHNVECGKLGERSYRAGRPAEQLPRMVRVLGRFMLAAAVVFLLAACDRTPSGVIPMCTITHRVKDAPVVTSRGDTIRVSATIPFRVPCDSVEAYR
jgi:hypothetical protein